MNKAIFLDLQGTLGGDAIGDITSFELYPFSIEALKLASKSQYLNIIITNQSRIGKGLLSMKDYEEKLNSINQQVNAEGAKIDDILCCPHTNKDNCICKKPKTGLIDLAVDKFNINLSNSFVIGDIGKNEIIMAHNAGTKGILVLTGAGKGSLKEYRECWKGYNADYIAEDALKAVEWIVSLN